MWQMEGVQNHASDAESHRSIPPKGMILLRVQEGLTFTERALQGTVVGALHMSRHLMTRMVPGGSSQEERSRGAVEGPAGGTQSERDVNRPRAAPKPGFSYKVSNQDPRHRTPPPGAFPHLTDQAPLTQPEPLLMCYLPHRAGSPSRSSLICLCTSNL